MPRLMTLPPLRRPKVLLFHAENADEDEGVAIRHCDWLSYTAADS